MAVTSPFSKCWLCGREELESTRHRGLSTCTSIGLSRFITMLAGGNTDPLLCDSCQAEVREREARAGTFHETMEGQRLLGVAEAMYQRDAYRIEGLYAGARTMPPAPRAATDAMDKSGRVHPHVLFQRTSPWEPYVGRCCLWPQLHLRPRPPRPPSLSEQTPPMEQQGDGE